MAGTLLSFLFLGAFAACESDRHGEARPHVVLILLDTVRRDHIGTYGYERDTTPVIDALARDGLVFEKAIAQSSWTLPSLASLLTSRYPAELFSDLGAGGWFSIPSGPIITVTEVLKASGYHTVGVTTNPYNLQVFRLMGGFDRRAHLTDASADWVVERTVEELDAALEANETDGPGPFFLFLHLMDTHFPLMVPAPFDTHFPTLDGKPHDDSHRKRLSYADPELLGTREFEVYRSHTLALYDGSLRFVDAQIGYLVSYLKKRGLYQNSVIIIAADHGQAFWDHAAEEKEMGLEHPQRRGAYGVGHGHTLFPELIDVPLIFHGKNVPRGRVEHQVRNVDIVPTLLAMVGADADQVQLRGVDLIAQWSAGGLADLPAFSETQTRSADQKGLQDGRHQYLRLDDREFLFDTTSGDLVDVSEEEPHVRDRLRISLDGMLRSFERPESRPTVIGEEVRRELRALGYAE